MTRRLTSEQRLLIALGLTALIVGMVLLGMG